jgi:hypothetical protein
MPYRLSSTQHLSGHRSKNISIDMTNKQSGEEESSGSDEESDSEEDVSDDEHESDMSWLVRCFLIEKTLPALELMELTDRQLIQDALGDLHKMIPTTPSSIRSCTGTESSSGTHGSSVIGQPSRGDRRLGSRRSLDGNGNQNAEGNEDDEEGEEQRDEPQRMISASNPQRLACPFFKKDPSKYQESRGCPGPGWVTVHRLK